MQPSTTRNRLPKSNRRPVPEPSTNGSNGHAKPAAPACPAPAEPPATLAATPVADAEQDPIGRFMEGRDPCGRFIRGNAGGPGNPFARRVAALRSALLEAITPERMRQLAERMHARALAGDIAAAALLLRYTLGNPGPAVDPDRLELESFRLLCESPDMVDVLRARNDLIAPALAAKILAGNLPVTGGGFVEKLKSKRDETANKVDEMDPTES